MSFMLRDVGLECFTLVFRGEDVGSVFSTDDDHDQPWIATLHRAHSLSAPALPAPFKTSLYRFANLIELKVWLGISSTAGAVEGAV